MYRGYIKLYRKISDNKMWLSESFSRSQAWIDLLLLANHEDGYFYLRDHKINVKRGQVGWSILKLSERWKWSRNKATKFIKDLEKEQQVEQQQSHSTTIITIINYEKYHEKEQQVEQQKGNRKATERQQEDTNKNDKNDNNDKEVYTQNFKNPESEKLSQEFLDLIYEINPNQKAPNLESWSKSFDLMIQRDERTPDQLRYLMQWLFKSTHKDALFWQKNILSPDKLRKHFDRLYLIVKGSQPRTDGREQMIKNLINEIDEEEAKANASLI